MKKIMIACAAILLFGSIQANAQGILDKIDRATDRVNRAGNTADRTKNTGDRLMGLFSKKKKDDASNADNKTTIKLSGATLSSLKKINEQIENSKGVSGTKMKFNSTTSSITVAHSGTTETLLKVLQKSVPGVFIEKNIDGFDEGEISVKIK